MTIVDVEQLGGVITDQLAELFDEEPKKHGRMGANLHTPPSVQPACRRPRAYHPARKLAEALR